VKKGSLDIQVLEANQLQENREAITRFVLSLQEERYTFALEVEDLIGSQCMLVARDHGGHWAGLSGWRPRWWGGVFYLVVHRDHQRQGLGKQLTFELARRVPKRMLLLLSVDRSNTRARKLYEDAGFVTLKRGKHHAYMAYRNHAYFYWGVVLRLVMLFRA